MTFVLDGRAQCPVCWYSIPVVDGRLKDHRRVTGVGTWVECSGSGRVPSTPLTEVAE